MSNIAAGIFGLLLLSAIFTVFIAVGFLIATGILTLFPKLEKKIMDLFGWVPYKLATASEERITIEEVNEAWLSQQIAFAARSRPSERKEPTYIDLATIRPKLAPLAPRPIVDGYVTLRQPQRCRNCGNMRRLFHEVSRVCLKCSTSRKESAVL